MSLSKKNLYIFLGILAVGLIGLAIYNAFFVAKDGGSEENADGSGLSASSDMRNSATGNMAGQGSYAGGTGSATGFGGSEEVYFRKFFRWQYAVTNYVISHDFYQSVMDKYSTIPRSYLYFSQAPDNKEEEYYEKFVTDDENLISSDIINKLAEKGRANHFSDDQMAEFVAAFVQYIPFDEEKATNIRLKAGTPAMNYPYEVLFNNKGVSFDRSFLLYSLLRKLGYGLVLYTYDNANHMAVGIQCPKEYSNYGSGYCYIETTIPGLSFGKVPDLTSYSGKAISSSNVSDSVSNAGRASQIMKLGNPKLYLRSTGKIYGGMSKIVGKTPEEIKQQNTLKLELEKKKKKIDELKSEIDEIQKELEGGYALSQEECDAPWNDMQDLDPENEASVNEFLQNNREAQSCIAENAVDRREKMLDYFELMREYKAALIDYYSQVPETL